MWWNDYSGLILIIVYEKMRSNVQNSLKMDHIINPLRNSGIDLPVVIGIGKRTYTESKEGKKLQETAFFL